MLEARHEPAPAPDGKKRRWNLFLASVKDGQVVSQYHIGTYSAAQLLEEREKLEIVLKQGQA